MARVLSELRVLVHELALNDDVVEVLLPSGRPHDIEGQLWDYKQQLPVAASRPAGIWPAQYWGAAGRA